MGRGDKKTKKGKMFMGSYGVSRPRKAADSITGTTAAAPTAKAPKAAATAEAAPKAAKPKAAKTKE